MNFKTKFIKKLCLLLFVITFIPTTTSLVSTAIDIAKYGVKGIQLIIKAEKIQSNRKWKANLKNSIIEIQNSTQKIESLITTEANRIIGELSIKLDMQLLRDFIQVVDTINQCYEKKFVKYHLSTDEYQTITIEKFANEIVNDSDFKKTLDKINHFIVPKYYLNYLEYKTLFDILLDYYQIKVYIS